MSVCNSDCAVDIPQFPEAGCEIVTRPSGIKRVIFARCDTVFLDLTDTAEWETKLTAHEVHATGLIKGAKPKGSFTKKKLDSCSPEKVTGGTKTINFTDANSDNATMADYDFYNHHQTNAGNEVFGYLTCDELFYGWFSDFSIELDDVRTDNSDDEMVFDVSIQYKAITMQKPILIAGLNAVLN